VKIRSYLLTFAVVILLPMVAFAALAVVAVDRHQRAAVEQGGVETARALVNAVDRELTGAIRALQTLGTERSLARDDLAEFHENARRALAIQREWRSIYLIAPSGRLVLDATVPFGTSLPSIRERPSFDEVLRTLQPAVGGITFGATDYAFPVRVPIVRKGEVTYVLTAVLLPAAIQEILRAQQIPEGWLAGVFDATNRVVARTRAAEQFVGRPISPDLQRLLESQREGWAAGRTLEGDAVYTAFSRSALTGWGVALGIQAAAVEAPMRRSLWAVGGAGLAVFLACVAASALVGRRIARPIVSLSEAVTAFGAGSRTPELARPGGPAEVEAVGRAFAAAAVQLRERGLERDEALALVDTLVGSAPIGVAFLDGDARFRRVNAAFATMAGIPPAQHLGRRVDDVLPGMASRLRSHVASVLETGEPVIDVELVTSEPEADGPRSWIVSFYPVAPAGHGVVGVGCLAVEATERRRGERERASLLAAALTARGEAEAANRAKDEFLAMLGHELRNPLGAIASAAHVLDRVEEPGRLGQARAIIGRQVQHLARMVDDLLDVARVTTGKIALRLQPVDLADCVTTCVGGLVAARRLDGYDLQVRVEPVWVDADPARLEQIVTNLVQNAIKYTPAGGRIRVSVDAQDGDALLRVEDNGAGIPADLLPRVFDLFVQGDRGLDRAHGGLGIGLTLVRRLVEMHDGKVDAASEGPGRGSAFSVRLPAIVPAKPTSAGSRPVPETAGRRRIVVIEDYGDARDSLRAFLELSGHEVHEAADGPTGVELVHRVQPDVALIDIGLPGLDGYEVARRLRAEPRTEHIVLVALTGYGRPEDRRRTRATGFDAHLIKPIDHRQLTDLLATYHAPSP
jgi:signal transduction histidine kinase